MGKFRKKPVVICAHRLGDDWPAWSMPIWEGVNQNKIILHMSGDDPHAMIHTLEGVMRANVGDWIIRGVAGEFYPCKPDIFAATYEPVADGMVDGETP